VSKRIVAGCVQFFGEGKAFLHSLGQFETPGYAPPGNETALHPRSVGMSGDSQGHGNVQPYLTFNFCIALSGANS
jgi:microcystin-dependent protein